MRAYLCKWHQTQTHIFKEEFETKSGALAERRLLEDLIRKKRVKMPRAQREARAKESDGERVRGKHKIQTNKATKTVIL
jgi:hypothetical protein